MPADPLIQYWVTYPNSYKPNGTVHRMGCDFFGRGQGRLLTPEDLAYEARGAKDCGHCKGRWPDG